MTKGKDGLIKASLKLSERITISEQVGLITAVQPVGL